MLGARSLPGTVPGVDHVDVIHPACHGLMVERKEQIRRDVTRPGTHGVPRAPPGGAAKLEANVGGRCEDSWGQSLGSGKAVQACGSRRRGGEVWRGHGVRAGERGAEAGGRGGPGQQGTSAACPRLRLFPEAFRRHGGVLKWASPNQISPWQ